MQLHICSIATGNGALLLCDREQYSLLLGLEDPAVVAYLRECGASCVEGYDGNKFALQFKKHDLYTDCTNKDGTFTRTENIGFHIADGKLHWFETEGDNAKKSWYDCKTGESSKN